MGVAPVISVVLVSDYAAGGAESWREIRAAVKALARQELDEPFEVVLVESERFRAEMPEDLLTILPSLRCLFYPELESYPLKNYGVEAALGEFVAILDADCEAEPSWLRGLLGHLRGDERLGAVSGKTVYPGDSFSVRMNALLARSYLDPGQAGETSFIAINNCAFRRAAYMAHPLPTDIGTFSSRIQSEMLLRDGWKLWFDPAITVVHDFEGWGMEADLRRNAGHGTVSTRLKDDSLPYARLARWGAVSIPVILAGKVILSWRDCLRCRKAYGVRWYELPVAMALSVGIHALEAPGMMQAYAGGVLRQSCFR